MQLLWQIHTDYSPLRWQIQHNITNIQIQMQLLWQIHADYAPIRWQIQHNITNIQIQMQLLWQIPTDYASLRWQISQKVVLILFLFVSRFSQSGSFSAAKQRKIGAIFGMLHINFDLSFGIGYIRCFNEMAIILNCIRIPP